MDIRLWLRLLTCTNLIEARIRRRLRDRYDITLPRFDVMAQLHREPEGLQMSELSRRLMVSNGNVTGLIDRLVAEGLVTSRQHPADKRSQIVALSAAGRAQFEAMLPEHQSWVAEIMSGLSQDQITQIYDLLAIVKAGAGGNDA
ncbi:MAG: MarR family transcriptional regulator [Alphaproteobacteria bacterium]|nr:MarR family transcriptional regulator [Alphaproteobacteria bacterium]